MKNPVLLVAILGFFSCTSCAFDEYGFPHIYFSQAPSSEKVPDWESDTARRSLGCPSVVVHSEMIADIDSPATSRPTRVARGCFKAWLVSACVRGKSGEPGYIYQPLEPARGPASDCARVAGEPWH